MLTPCFDGFDGAELDEGVEVSFVMECIERSVVCHAVLFLDDEGRAVPAQEAEALQRACDSPVAICERVDVSQKGVCKQLVTRHGWASVVGA